jgi:hypothetical protein
LRPDGFAGYEQVANAHDTVGKITTKPLEIKEAVLKLTADIMPGGGFVEVCILDKKSKVIAESRRMNSTGSDMTVNWKDGFMLKPLKGKKYSMEFRFRTAKIYAFGFGEK